VHRHDRAVFEPEAFDLVRHDVEAVASRLLRDRFGQRRITGQIVAQVLDHLRCFVAGEGTAMLRIGVDVIAEIGQPVRIEHDKGRNAARPGTAAQLAQGRNRTGPRTLKRTALGFRQHQRRHVGDLGGENKLSQSRSPLRRNRRPRRKGEGLVRRIDADQSGAGIIDLLAWSSAANPISAAFAVAPAC